ncbi:hypothetical protein FZO89_04575 [Luteimonas viscosa]|uniref:Dicarboxylate transport n=1 Tax=Luteimonas viscosa TaxID=1132694 RepID=A0A5D4XNA0_9GAMM|nr:hypothetical protein [Luteimonas viscosa]TYT25594.1 hypothetical protein FZO89_04575 [Luteimonas viscosa]
MPARILTLLLMALAACQVQARTATASIATIRAPGVELRDVRVRLHWPAGATSGELRVEAARIEADALGYRYEDVRWQCPLARADDDAWRCAGPLRGQAGAPMHLSVDLSSARTDAVLSQRGARLAVHRNAAAPDATQLRLERVPLAWAQALLAQAWAAGRLDAGVADGAIALHTPADRPLRVEGRLALTGVALESQDASVAVGDIDGSIVFDYRQPDGAGALVAIEGDLRDGEVLVGNTYLALGARPVRFAVDARQLPGGGWAMPRLAWQDADTLSVEGSAGLAADGGLRQLELDARSQALGALPERYLSGWLGLAGLSGLQLAGSAGLRLRVDAGEVVSFDADFDAVDVHDPQQRFRIDGLHGTLRHASGAAVESELRWRDGALYDLAFGPIRLPMRSEAGTLRLREAADLAMLGGKVRLDGFTLQPPRAGSGLRLGFGLELEALDLGQLAQALGWPAFRGTLGGSIPSARYADERLEFDGGLSMQLFEGRVDVGALAMERPFGVAPTLSADLSLHDLDLLGITEVFDFGSITGRLHGRIDDLRLVDWTATAFDAELHTQPRAGVRQRISQRAVQDISSVGDASFVSSLQGRLIGLFDDFGYRRMGIGCRLANEVCRMSGLHSAGEGFTIVEGAGVPKLQVVGFNRDVDWPTLVERLAAVASGDVAPVVE